MDDVQIERAFQIQKQTQTQTQTRLGHEKESPKVCNAKCIHTEIQRRTVSMYVCALGSYNYQLTVT